MWAMVSESIPPESRYVFKACACGFAHGQSRSHAFYYIFSAFYVAELISSSIASVTLDISPWIPCGLAMGSVMACLALLALMPDPRPLSSSARNEASAYPSENPLEKSSVKGLLSALSNRNIQLTIPVFLVGIFRYAMLNILIQYASVRFGLRISTGATFYTETAVVNIFLFLFLVPQLTAHVRKRYNVQPHVIDLFLVRTSVTLMCIGCLAIALAQTSFLLPVGASPLYHKNFTQANFPQASSSSHPASVAGSLLWRSSLAGSQTTPKPPCSRASSCSRVSATRLVIQLSSRFSQPPFCFRRFGWRCPFWLVL